MGEVPDAARRHRLHRALRRGFLEADYVMVANDLRKAVEMLKSFKTPQRNSGVVKEVMAVGIIVGANDKSATHSTKEADDSIEVATCCQGHSSSYSSVRRSV